MELKIDQSASKWECRIRAAEKESLGISAVDVLICVCLQSYVCALLLLLYRYFKYRTSVMEESILIFKEIGIQLVQTRRNGTRQYRFIDSKDIQHVFINEGIQLSRVIFYLAFQEKNDTTKLTLAFTVSRLNRSRRGSNIVYSTFNRIYRI